MCTLPCFVTVTDNCDASDLMRNKTNTVRQKFLSDHFELKRSPYKSGE